MKNQPEHQFTWLALAPLVQAYVSKQDLTLEPEILRETVRGLIANGYAVPRDMFVERASVEYGLVHILFDEGQAVMEITAQGVVTSVL